MSIESFSSFDGLSKLNVESTDINIEDPIAQEAIKILQHIVADPESKIDSGGAGTVYRIPDGVCMKVFDKRKEGLAYKSGNTVAGEARFNQFLSAFSRNGVRSPRYIGRITALHPERMEVILMEELRALNLQRVLNGEIPPPDSFQLNPFLEAFESYMYALNEELLIAHGDLEPRNVMIDKKTGMPRIIDFGQSSWLRSLDPDERRRRIQKDFGSLERISEQVEEFWKKLTSKG